jgi:hypothetical protein
MLQAAEIKTDTGWGVCTDTYEDPELDIATDDMVDIYNTNYVTGC